MDFDIDRNWLINSYLAGELQNIESYLMNDSSRCSDNANSQSVNFSEALDILNQQAYK